jgi:hypothetical protein
VDAAVAIWAGILDFAAVARFDSGGMVYLADRQLDADAHALVLRFVGRQDWNERERAWFDSKGAGMQALCYTASDPVTTFQAAAERGMQVGAPMTPGPDGRSTGWLTDCEGHEFRVAERLPFADLVTAMAEGQPLVI